MSFVPRFVICLVLLSGACATPQTTPDAAPASAAPSNTVTPADRPDVLATYPATRREAIREQLFGHDVEDPYRWLEREKDPEVVAWMQAQDAFTRTRLDALPGRAALAQRFTELSYIDSVSAPTRRGDRYFYSRRHANKEKAVYYYRVGESGPEQVLLDPNALSADGSVSVHGIFPSWDGKLLAYKLSRNNADAATMYLREIDSGKELGADTIEGAKYAAASWTPDNKGFYYTWLPTDSNIPIDELPGRAEIRFHAVGTPANADAVVHPATNDPTSFIGAWLSRDGRYLVFSRSHGWNSTDVYFKDLRRPNAKPKAVDAADPATLAAGFHPLVVGQPHVYDVTPWKNRFYVHTNEGASRYRVFAVDPNRPERVRWKEIVPEDESTLEGVQVVGGHLVLNYLKHAYSEMRVADLSGTVQRTVALPGIGSTSGMTGNPEDDTAYFSYSSFVDVPQIYKTSIASGETSLWEKIDYPVDTRDLEVTQVWPTSKDGTRLSMFVVHKKGVRLDRSNPTLLYGYGGFSVSLTPSFSTRAVVWLEHGGVYAVANLRGGGEYGEAWHQAGMQRHKQNVFDDFAAAAQHLVDSGYTSSNRLAIMGGSNGGLLVGAAMTQHPKLVRAVVCAVPLLDMLRYHQFGSGRTWISEYGSPENADDFATLLGYSPYHHVEAGASYPALLMLSADSDDRVDPMHARKFTAAVQAASASGLPALLRVETNAGHGGGDMVIKQVEQSVDTFAFLFSELGMQ